VTSAAWRVTVSFAVLRMLLIGFAALAGEVPINRAATETEIDASFRVMLVVELVRMASWSCCSGVMLRCPPADPSPAATEDNGKRYKLSILIC
jgi:hypothetical protein